MPGFDMRIRPTSIALDLRDGCASVIAMWRAIRLCLVLCTFGLSSIACTAIVGDACLIDADCGAGLICDASQPEGYCTRANCAEQECPDEALCVTYDADTSYCVLPCTSAGDCRDGYLCVDDFGLHPFCAPTGPSP